MKEENKKKLKNVAKGFLATVTCVGFVGLLGTESYLIYRSNVKEREEFENAIYQKYIPTEARETDLNKDGSLDLIVKGERGIIPFIAVDGQSSKKYISVDKYLKGLDEEIVRNIGIDGRLEAMKEKAFRESVIKYNLENLSKANSQYGVN